MAKGPKSEFPGKTTVFSTRIRPDLRQKLDQAVQRNGLTISDEVARRLNRTFLEDERINDLFGDRRTFMLMRLMADAIHFDGLNTRWLDDPVEFEKALSAALRILEAIQPESPFPADAPPALAVQVRGHRDARVIWQAVKRADPSLPLNNGNAQDRKNRVIKEGLDCLADRAFENDKPGKPS